MISTVSRNHAKVAKAVYEKLSNTEEVISFYKDMIYRKLECKINTEDYLRSLNVTPTLRPYLVSDSSDFFVENYGFNENSPLFLSALMLLLPNCPRLGTLYFNDMEIFFYNFVDSGWNTPVTPYHFVDNNAVQKSSFGNLELSQYVLCR